MGALDTFLAKGIRFELLKEDQIRARGTLYDSLCAANKAAKSSIINELHWREFESLLKVVAPAYNTPAHELEEIRDTARNDLASALISYRLMAKQIERR